MPYNLTARCSLLERIDLDDLLDWYSREPEQITTESFRHVARYVGTHWQDFVRFAEKPLLLWQGCDRVQLDGEKKYHRYPGEIKYAAKRLDVKLDSRPTDQRGHRSISLEVSDRRGLAAPMIGQRTTCTQESFHMLDSRPRHTL